MSGSLPPGLRPDDRHDVVIIIPTVANPNVLVPTMARLTGVAPREPVRVGIVLSVNSPDNEAAERALDACRKLCAAAEIDLLVHQEAGPIGFGAANNRGTIAMFEAWGVPELTIYHNDDAHPSVGWLTKLLATLRTDTIHGYSEPWEPTGDRQRTPRPRELYGKIGLVGPVSNLVAGIQLCQSVWDPACKAVGQFGGDIDAFAELVQRRYGGQHVTADFLSGFCVGIGRDALLDLLLMPNVDGELVPWAREIGTDEHPFVYKGTTEQAARIVGGVVGPWDEVSFPVAGYEDNDLCLRAELLGWRKLVSAGCFVGHIGHQTFDLLFPDMLRGMRNRARYYDKWRHFTRPNRELKLVAAIRQRFEVGHDFHLLRNVLKRVGDTCDGLALVLTANPLDVRDHGGWPSEQKLLAPDDWELLNACNAAGQPAEDGTPPDREAVAKQIAAAMHAWCAKQMPGSRIGPEQISVEVWTKGFNERDERNRTHELAEALGADWILSVDGDEVIEDRIQRWHLERYMRNPNPDVWSYDQSWINHYESGRVVWETPPWGDGGKYTGGMHGFRLWRVPRLPDTGALVDPPRIFAGTDNGLHCGNSPDRDIMSKRVSGMRFRHFGYTRRADRERKHLRYRIQDANPDPLLTGNSGPDAYSHILEGEGHRVSEYSPVNGIGLHVLLHRGEPAHGLASLLDTVYAVVDRIVVVWTGAWSDEDKRWLAPPVPEELEMAAKLPEHLQPRPRCAQAIATLPPEDVATGPTYEQAQILEAFGCELVHQPLNDDLASARNAGLGALCMRAHGLGWSLFMDLDEHWTEPFGAMVALRRMAECTDAHGWLFTFVNHHEGQKPSISESIRMARLIPGMVLSGRVHETFDAALVQFRKRATVKIRPAPFQVHHVGLAGSAEQLDKKLQRYQRWLLLELMDNPHNSSAWVSLALHALNDGDDDIGLECLKRAVLCPDPGYLAPRELAYFYLRRALPLLGEAMRQVSPGHDFYRKIKPLHDAMVQYVPDMPKLGSAQLGLRSCPRFELPDFTLPPRPAGFTMAELDAALPMDGTMPDALNQEPATPAPDAPPVGGDTDR